MGRLQGPALAALRELSNRFLQDLGRSPAHVWRMSNQDTSCPPQVTIAGQACFAWSTSSGMLAGCFTSPPALTALVYSLAKQCL